jgi:hypothetical protein
MEDFSVEKPRIARLTGPNYRPWSVQVRRLLVGAGLWDIVSQGLKTTKKPETGDSTAPEARQPETPEPTEDQKKAGAKASTIIMGLCSQDSLQHILLLETAQEQWEALKTLYQPLGRQ